MTTYVVNTSVDAQALLNAGVPQSSIKYSGSTPAGYPAPSGLDTYSGGGSAVYVGLAGMGAPKGAQTLEGKNRNETATMVNAFVAGQGGAQNDQSGSASAKAVIQQTLDGYGLGSLGGWAWQKYLTGEPVEQIMLELRGTPEYKARFPAMDQLRKQGMALSESAYIEYERNAGQLMRSYGLPAGFYDSPQDYANLLTGNVSLSELNDRLSAYQSVAVSAPPEVRDYMQTHYGLSTGDLLAQVIDPNVAEPIIAKKAQAAIIGGTAAQAGFGDLGTGMAERLVGDGVTQAQAQKGFGQIASQAQLGMTLPGEKGQAVSQDQFIGAAFEGNAQAQQAVERQAGQRVAKFSGGGGYAGSSNGVSGLGSANA